MRTNPTNLHARTLDAMAALFAKSGNYQMARLMDETATRDRDRDANPTPDMLDVIAERVAAELEAMP